MYNLLITERFYYIFIIFHVYIFTYFLLYLYSSLREYIVKWIDLVSLII